MLEIVAPAKINLSLKIIGKRPDGYHDIDTRMVPLTLADRLTMEKCTQQAVLFHCNDPCLPTNADNLVVKAAALFLERSGIRQGVRIFLEKHIPHGAGLGGGSSDAASTLLGMNQLFATGLTTAQLLEMAARIGSDVPFFLFESAARCRGRGEIVEPEGPPPALELLLVKPPFGVPTPWAYGQWAGSKEIDGVPYAPQKFAWGTLENDMERPVFAKYLVLAHLKQWLLQQSGVQGALLSGSGSTVFAVLTAEASQGALNEGIHAEFGQEFQTYFCRTR